MSIVIDLTGQKFSYLSVVGREGTTRDRKATWRCVCDCGSEVVVTGRNLRSGRTKSCGCSRQHVRKGSFVAVGEPRKISDRKVSDCAPHGKSKTRTHNIWQRIRQACYNPKNPKYPRYGGRGIKVCDRWLESFENFLSDMGECPDGLTLDREDVNGDYTPENCRWATPKQQSNNRNYNKLYTYREEALTLAEWAERFDVPYHRLYQRVCILKWDIEKAFNTEKLC